MNRSETLVVGFALGAAVTYLLDRDRGKRRRALVRDKLVHAGHTMEDAAVANARHARNRATGLIQETRSGLTDREVDDRIVEERVRSEIGRHVSGPANVDVTADQGRVMLSGNVPAHDLQNVVRAVKSVRGVRAVENQLDSSIESDGRSRQEAERS